MPHSLRHQCWALAGVAQAANCVQATAQGKAIDEDAVLALYKALLTQNSNSVEELAGLGDFSLGLSTSLKMLHRPDENIIQAFRYVLDLLAATSHLRKQDPAVARLAKGVAGLDASAVHAPEFDSYDVPWTELADIYVDTLGTLNKRVKVHGDRNNLQRPEVASKVRGLLLMGVRFAWLWHQLGGRRWHLLVNRRRMWQTTQLIAQPGNSGDSL